MSRRKPTVVERLRQELAPPHHSHALNRLVYGDEHAAALEAKVRKDRRSRGAQRARDRRDSR